MGPLTLERQRRIVEEHVADAVAKGARVLTGGATPAGPGFFYPPTVLVDVDHTMTIMREETFGPVLPIMAVDSLDEAIRLANDSPYGLTASGWTRSEETARRLQRELVAGVVTINDHVSSFGEPTAPWGGVKWSGIGRIHGLARPARDGAAEVREPRPRPRAGAVVVPLRRRVRRASCRARPPPSTPRRSCAGSPRSSASLRFARLWRRFGPWRLLANLDKLF